jgi:ribosomal protein S12 methylthiotransferase
MNVNLVSLGCSKNLVDSERILGALGASGAALCASPHESDVLIINTCGFIAPALDETEDEIQKMLQHSKNGKRLYVIGCAVNRYGHKLKAKYPEVTGWFRLEEIPDLLKSLGSQASDLKTRLLTTRGYAYLKVSEGCTNKCSYCTIPSIKGPYHSFELDELVREGRDLVELGAQELILIGQDTTRYGQDLCGKPMLPILLNKLSKIEDLVWLRLLYAHPKTISLEIIDEIEHNDKVCKYIDLPIQHINTRILSMMNRATDRPHIEQVLKRLKKIAGMTIRTTIIVGFPTETDAEFEELMEFIDRDYFDWLGVFPYFPESGTKAAGFEQLPDRIVEQRYKRALKVQEQILKNKNQSRINTRHMTLIHARQDSYIGHAGFGAPELDSHIILNHENLQLGQFYKVRITDCRGCDLEAQLVTEQVEAH